MPEYKGEAEVHAGGFDYVVEHGYGHELLNFDSIDGRLWGYVRASSGTINIDQLGASTSDDYVDDVRVIFIATKPSHGPVVVGWYEGARVWRKIQPGFRSVPTRPEILIDYQIEAQADRAFLVSVKDRNFDIPNRSKGFPGQSAVYFPSRHPQIGPWLQKFDAYQKQFINQPASIGGAKFRRTRKPNAVHNALVEKAAIDAVIEKLGPPDADRQPHNCGWDLEFIRNGRRLCVEVKGVSGLGVSAEVTPNEYMAIQRVVRGEFTEGDYRLAIVTDALGGRNLHLFALTPEGIWQCEFSNIRIEAIERRAAIFR